MSAVARQVSIVASLLVTMLTVAGPNMVSGQVAVSARWKADFANGRLILESRNLERLGSNTQTIRPDAVDQALLDEFGRLVLALPNRFRELARR